MLARLLLAMMLLSFSAPSIAQVYRCTDPHGRVQFVQVPPKDGSCDQTAAAAAPAPASAESGADRLRRFGEQIDESRAQEARQREAAAQQVAARKQRCIAATKRRALLDRYGSRIFTQDDAGNRHYMSEPQYQSERRAVEQAIKTECS